MIRPLNIKEITSMSDLHCYNYYEEDEDYSERDEIKMEVQNSIVEYSDEYEFGMDNLTFTINQQFYMFYICDEFINMTISKANNNNENDFDNSNNYEILINTKNPNAIIKFVNDLFNKKGV